MHIQPLLLTLPHSLPGVAPGRSARGTQAGEGTRRNEGADAANGTRATAENDAARLEISPAAQSVAAQEAGENGLSPEEQQQVEELKQRDTEVRAHEQAHLAAAGPHARGGPTYTYQRGPDGQQYAIGGEVQIDTSPVDGDPAATIQKARQIRAAASAPSEPSSQDRQVAAAAAQMESQSRAELQQQQEVSGGQAATGANPRAAASSAGNSASFYNQLIQAAYRPAAAARGFNAWA